jgi:hypothetical protein
LVGAVLVSAKLERGVSVCFAIAFICGSIGVLSMVLGAMMLVRETRFSFRILREESYAGFGLSRYAQRSAIRRFAIRQITIPAN